MRIFLKGGANPSGFIIQEGWNWASSKDFFSFKPKLNIVNELLELSVSIALIFLLGLMLMTRISYLETNIVRLMACFIIYLFYVFKPTYELVGNVLIKTLRQWHSCEHKIINLLEKGAEPTLESLKKVSPLTKAASRDQEYFVKIVSGLAACLFLVFTKINLFLCLGIGAGMWFILFLLSEKIIFPVQYLLFKEPAPEQYEEALRVAREFLAG